MLLKCHPENPALRSYMENSRKTCMGDCFYLNGHLKLSPKDNITECTIHQALAMAEKALHEYGGACNTWEQMSIDKHNAQFYEFVEVFMNYTRKKRLSGLLRAIVFWLSPARKRAAEIVFAPHRLEENGYFKSDADVEQCKKQ